MEYINKMYERFKDIVVKVFTSKFLYLAISIICIIVYYYNLLANNIKGLKIKNYDYYVWFIIILGLLVIASIIIYYILKHTDLKLYKKYFLVAIILSSFYVFTPPMFTQSDETFHYIRAYQIADGHLISKYDSKGRGTDKLPKSIKTTIFDDKDKYPEYRTYADTDKALSIKLDKNVKSKTYIHCASYVFLDYIPAVIGMKVGMLLNLSPYVIGVLGRLTNMIICTLIFALGLKRLPYAKKTMMILLLCPVVLAYTSSISADTVINSVSFLFIATILMHIKAKKQLSIKDYIELILMIIIISVCKTTYLPLIGLIILLPKENFGSIKKRILSIVLLIILGLVSSIIWMKVGGISIASEVGNHNFIETIVIYFNKLINTIFNEGLSYIQNIFAGDYFYQRQVTPAGILPIIYLFIFIFSYLTEETNVKIEKFYKVAAGLIGVLIFLLIMYALYAAAQKNKTMFIYGVQGRYFIPIMWLAPIFINKQILKLKNTNVFFVASVLINISIILTIYVSFIG